MGGVGSDIDFWDVLDDAEQTVERWPSWQREVEADVYYEEPYRAGTLPHDHHSFVPS